MKNGYKIFWTENALAELANTIEYIETNFTEKEIKRLVEKIENITALISHNPNIFPVSEHKNVHKVVVLKLNTIYYRINEKDVDILSFFSNRQSLKKRKI